MIGVEGSALYQISSVPENFDTKLNTGKASIQNEPSGQDESCEAHERSSKTETSTNTDAKRPPNSPGLGSEPNPLLKEKYSKNLLQNLRVRDSKMQRESRKKLNDGERKLKKDEERTISKLTLFLMGATAKQSGERLKSRYSELLLNLTVVGSILAAFAYDAFESQTEIVKNNELEQYFVAFCLMSVLSNILAIIFALYLWDKVALCNDEHMFTLVNHYKQILRIPRWMIMIGGMFFLILLYIQGHLDYGEYVDIVFPIIYVVAITVGVSFFIWARHAQNSFRNEILNTLENKERNSEGPDKSLAPVDVSSKPKRQPTVNDGQIDVPRDTFNAPGKMSGVEASNEQPQHLSTSEQ
eukprot:CAMPEP_0184492360 /NCGR_PEP_ID=MMETSP0113_2-20130426/22999_1 /TAXON_ID=91329 /ORGANISM="Norrisiella sphaerica, Strain BC52" /LENGTH=354 /DNA_ID=CAMNT_0026877103 /DNA_START=21 /DNA_END=1085 /DNA_ORIENTATION=+